MRANDGLKQLLNEFAIESGSDPGLRLQIYLSLIEKWNPRINLTANTAWNALEPLFREGIWAASKYPADCRTHLDIGSGAGFPAMILRILNPEMTLELVESRGKKGAFLETAAWEMGLSETRVHVKRLEDLLSEYKTRGGVRECVSWKAVRLTDRNLLGLHNCTNGNTRFWMFHGRETAVENILALDAEFILAEKHPVPGQKESFLSIYRYRSLHSAPFSSFSP